MAEALAIIGVSASIAQLLSNVANVGSQLLQVRKTTGGSQRVFERIANQLPLLDQTLREVHKNIRDTKRYPNDSKALAKAIDGCSHEVALLAELLQGLDQRMERSWIGRSRKVVAYLKEEKRIADIENSIDRYKGTIALHLTHANFRPCHASGSQEEPSCFVVPMYQTSHFVGRREVIAKLLDLVTSSSTPSPQPKRVVIQGMGGLGKSRLALELCDRAWQKKVFRCILWADASSPVTLRRSFEGFYDPLCERTASDTSDSNSSLKIKLVKSKLSKMQCPWLMILDNFDQPELYEATPIQDFFPNNISGSSAIIITSRHLDAARLGSTIYIEAMSEDEGLDLLFERSGRCRNHEDELEGRLIVQSMACLPLAIDQSAAYIAARQMDFKDFHKHYRDRKAAVLSQTPELWEYRKRIEDVEKESSVSVFTTWELSFRQIHDTEQNWKAHFLTASAFLDVSNVSESLFSTYFKSNVNVGRDLGWLTLFATDNSWDGYKFGDIVLELSKLSLLQKVDCGAGQCHFSLHPLVRDWIVLRQAEDSRRLYTKLAVSIVAASAKVSEACQSSFNQRQRLLFHLDICLQNAKSFLSGAEGGNWASIEHEVMILSSFYKLQARYTEAQALQEQILSICERNFGNNDPRTLDAALLLGKIHGKIGNYANAEKHLKRALSGQESNNGSSDTHTVESAVVLASNHYKRGQYAAAEPLLQNAIQHQSSVLGQRHWKTLWSVMILAMVYKKRALYSRAEELYQQALEGQEAQLGSDHPDTLKTVMNLASAKCDQGKYAEAETLSKRVVSGRETKLGPHHPNTLRSIWNLARVYTARGSFTLAEEHFLRALSGQDTQLGPDHPFTLKTVKDLAYLRYRQKRFPEAQSLYEHALMGLTKASGAEHVNTLQAANGLACVYREQKDYARANALFEQTLTAQQSLLGHNHPDTLRTARDSGKLYYEVGNVAYALEIIRLAYAGFEITLGLKHPETWECALQLARFEQDVNLCRT